MYIDRRELKEQNDTAAAVSREHISYGSKFACTWGHYWPSCPETWAGGASRGGVREEPHVSSVAWGGSGLSWERKGWMFR